MNQILQKIYSALGWPLPQAGRARSAAASPDRPRRSLERKRQRLLDAFVVSEGMIAARACTVVDLTALGAAIQIWDANVKASLISGNVLLYIPSDNKEVPCTVQWRRDGKLGLKFSGPFRAPTRSYR